MDNVENVSDKNLELIRLYVVPQINTNNFHEVNPSQLEEYLNERRDQKHNHKRNQYHQLGIIAKVDINTTDMELDRLLQNEVRTLLIQAKCNKPQNLEQILLKINTSVDKFNMESSFRTPIGIAVEINGEQLTTGRLRNESKPYLDEGHVMVLTTNEDYKYCCFKEIVYVSNLWRYLGSMQLGDVVDFGGGEILTRVVKCGPVTVEVIKAGHLSSYTSVHIPYYIETRELVEKSVIEVETAISCGAHFIVISGVRSAAYLRAVREHIGENIKLIGSIDFEYADKKFIDIADTLLELDAVWFENLFCPSLQKCLSSAITQCKAFEKTMVGSVPLKTCSDFKKLENHNRIKQMDCLLIEKSPLQNKFPLVVKKLLRVGNGQIEVPALNALSCREGILNFVLRTIYSIPCRGIVVSNTCPQAAVAFANPKIYCPVIAVVKSDYMARQFNLRRNLKSVVCEESDSPTEYGITFARKIGLFTTGDFIISLSDGMDEGSQICVNLRAYFLPPIT